MCFFVLSTAQLFHSFNMRSEKSVFSRDVRPNPFVFIAFFACLAMVLSAMLIPGISSLFGTVPLSAGEWIASVLLAVTPLATCEIYKLFKHN